MARLETVGVGRTFGDAIALHPLDLTIDSGEIVAVIGENGAGKSTLLNLWSGTLRPSTGSIRLDGEVISPSTHREANLLGVWRVFQESALIPGLSVYENLLLGHETTFVRRGLLDRRRMIATAQAAVDELGLEVDVREPLYRFGVAQRQALEVARVMLLPAVLGRPPGHVLFDEPTTGLTRAEVERLLDHMRRLRDAGVGVVFVSHRLPEVFEVADRIVVLKDGRLVADRPAGELTERELHQLMVGRERVEDHYLVDRQHDPAELQKPAVLDVQNLASPLLAEVSLQVRAGEIVGVGGLLGSGKGDLLRTLAGLLGTESGSIHLGGKELSGDLRSRKRHGVAFVSGDRQTESLITSLTVERNLSLASGEAGASSSRLGWWNVRGERATAEATIAAYRVKAEPTAIMSSLSGGNQQKIALARGVAGAPRLLLIENPTAGVDVGGKFEIYRLLRDLADRGAAILYVTDELPELIGLSDRILVMRDGAIGREFAATAHDKPSEHDLVAEMIGSQQDPHRRGVA